MNTKQLRQKILDLAIRGKLVPQDPNDEPASELLERIKVEKERLTQEGKIKRSKKEVPLTNYDKRHYGKFEIPESWVWASLGNICEPQETKKPTGEAFRYIDIDSIDNKRHCVTEPKNIPTASAPSRAAKGLRFGDILFSMVRPYLENIAYIPQCLEDCIASTGFYVCRAHINAIFPMYFYYSLISNYAIQGVSSHMRGDNSPAIRKNEMDNFLIPIPPLAEQHRIVTAIESAFAVIDEIEQNKADLQSAVTAAKSKILSLAISGKLVPQDPNDEPANVLLERIKSEREKLTKSDKIKRGKADSATVKDCDTLHYGKLPQGWAWSTLGELAFYKKGPFGSSITKAMFVTESESAVKVYEQKNAIYKNHELGTYYISTEKFSELKGFEVFSNDIIVSCAGTIGETYVMPASMRRGIINQALMRVMLYDYALTDFYLIYFDFILKNSAQKDSKGTAIKNIPPFDILKQYEIPLPPLAEQKRIAAAIESIFSQLDNIVAIFK